MTGKIETEKEIETEIDKAAEIKEVVGEEADPTPDQVQKKAIIEKENLLKNQNLLLKALNIMKNQGQNRNNQK